MDKLTQVLVFFVVVTSMVASYSTIYSKEDLSLKQRINASLAVDSNCMDKSKRNYASCSTSYQPVCGCDGRTYWTACHAEREGVISWEKGSCRQLIQQTTNP